MTNGKGNDDDNRRDLTRIEDLSEFLHEENPDLENIFSEFNNDSTANEGTRTDVTSGVSISELPDTPEEIPPELPDLPEDTVSEMNFESTDGPLTDFNFEEETITFENQEESVFAVEDETVLEVPQIESQIENDEAPAPIEENIPHYRAPIEALHQERFDEVKNFAQNFSYGQIQGGGNPPFSLVIRNLKYEQDAEDILVILREFGLIDDKNEEESKKALAYGSLLVPQISEYCAIVLTHKFRRFDCDIEVGLSDEIHPSKSGEANPKGLIKKDSLRQNISESMKMSDSEVDIKDVLVTTTPTLEGYEIIKYLGVQSSFAIVEENELERLKFVQKSLRQEVELHNYETDETVSSEKAFDDFKNSFDRIFSDLRDQLKMKAMKEKANALIGLNYQLSNLPFEKSADGGNCYQLICTATMAVIKALK